MKVNTKNLLALLQKAQQGTLDSSIVEQAGHFIFTKKCVFTYNDDLSVRIPFESEYEFSVNAKDLFRFLSGINQEEIELQVVNEELSIVSGDIKAGISVQTEVEDALKKAMEDLAVDDQTQWEVVPPEFYDGLTLCAASTSNEVTQKLLMCVCVRGQNMYSTDLLRLSKHTLSSSMKEFLLPNKLVSNLSYFKLEKYNVSKSWVHFKAEDDIVVSCRIVDGVYPDIPDNAFDAEDAEEFKYPADLVEKIKSVLVFVEDDDAKKKQMQIELSAGKLAIKAKKIKGWATREMLIMYQGIDLSFGINPDFLLNIIGQTNSMKLCKSTILFETETFTHSVAVHNKG